MKGSRFTATQIIAILKEVETGMLVKDVCRKYGISDATYYNWKSKYGGLSASDLKRMKEMEAELSRLKRMYGDMALENRALKGLIEKKAVRLPEKLEAVHFLVAEHNLSVQRSVVSAYLGRPSIKLHRMHPSVMQMLSVS